MYTCNYVHQKWPIYQEFLTHLADFVLFVYVYKSCPWPKWLLSGMSIYPVVHLSSGPFKWSALYLFTFVSCVCGGGGGGGGRKQETYSTYYIVVV